ncbi:MAG: iron ABC transporter permease [Spirochaetaceae bacterium]|nr:iron ABC transporter permease [Spirochaetaceae bacterium]
MRHESPATGRGEYNRYLAGKWAALLSLALVLSAMFVLSISVGSSGLSIAETLRTIFGGGTASSRAIIWNVRMPRIATAISVGIALAMTGCVMQNVLRNPLASASTLGVSQGASFGAAFAIVNLGAGIQVNAGAALTITNPYMVTVCAFLGGIATTAMILGLSRVSGVTPSVMVLAGVALSSLFAGATALVQYFCDDVVVTTIVYWTFGNLGRAGWAEIALIFFLGVAAFLYFIFNRWNYNAMESGTHTAKSLGVPVDMLILVSMTVCALISSAATAFVGTINFIGLIAPHIVRRFAGNDYRFLIPGSALTGAVIMMAADIVSRMLIAPTILPIGALTSFLGAPLFLYMIIKEGKH